MLVFCLDAALTGLVARPILEPSANDMRRFGEQLVPPPRGGWFDSKSIGACSVLYDPSSLEWTMWYAGRPLSFDTDVAPIATGYVGMARSKDGINWQRVSAGGPLGSCLGPADDNDDAFDAVHVAVGDIVADANSKLTMYYFGGGQEARSLGSAGQVRGMRMGISTCSSSDSGLTWCRDGSVGGSDADGAALLMPTDGAEMFIGWPTVVRGGGGGASADDPAADVLFYHACDLTSGGKFAIARASRGDDGHFKADEGGYVLTAGDPGAFDAAGVSARSVLRHPAHPERWLMVYEGQSEDRKHSIGLAKSEDYGATWTRIGGGKSVFEPATEPGAWDDGAVARPYVVLLPDSVPDEANGDTQGGWPRARMYYLGRSADGKRQGIGVAESVNDSWTEWRRVQPQDSGTTRRTKQSPAKIRSEKKAVSDLFKPDSLGGGTTEGTKW